MTSATRWTTTFSRYRDHVVLDTDVASRIFKAHRSGSPVQAVVGRPWCLTFVTVGELWRWAGMRRWCPRTRRELEAWLHGVLVLPYDDRVSKLWGDISAAAALRGRPRPQNDTWIAACCLLGGLPLVTGNVKDLVDFAEYEGLRLVGS